jgi:chromosome segregation ATPase
MKYPMGILREEAGEGTGSGAGNGGSRSHASAGNGTITAEELEKRLADARREEKAKLYPDIDRLKQDLQKKDRDLADLKASLAAAEEGSRRAQSLEQKIADTEKKINGMTEQFSKAIDDALENQKKSFEETRKKDQLDARKEALLSTVKIKVKTRGADGTEVVKDDYEVIPELVTGNTPEELQANFERSRQRYQEIRGLGETTASDRLGAPLREALPRPVVPGSESSASAAGDVAGGISSWRRMSPQEWDQKKGDIKAKIFADAGLPMKNR